ncbi:Arylsulfatase [Rubripirellula tenax]|uniref:Arylsulfatase n=1 Tax=Rubripirellula tenax TaxID=2528015 RepID=A0A5C6F762_9BACT|nr:arylsulfatase [Rubripirellula tenax]TWU57055.1 Arylsulfatase [Rubripirellula tenax]
MRQMLFLFWVCLVSVVFGVAQAESPNVVFILADDLGYRELGSFGQAKIRTPNLDRLAASGMRLTQHYSGNAVCAPSRCVLLTGKHPGHAFVRDNRSTPPEGQYPIPDDEVTLHELMKRVGYVTGAFGKWGLGGPGSTGVPLSQGVDRFVGYLCQSKAHTYYPDSIWDDGQPMPLANTPPIPGHAGLAKDADPNDPQSYDVFKGQDYAPDRINAAALDFVRTNKDTPFFLYYPSVIPHVALHVPEEELKPYLKLGWNDPPFTRDGGGYTPHFTPRAAYAAMISRLDRYVGNLLALLDELDLTDNTIVVFTSDNGTTHLGEEVDYKFFDSVGELRGLKGSLYEGGVRVPTIVRWPGHVTPGSVSDHVSGFEDWVPTLLEVVGGAEVIPNAIDGISMLPTLVGKSQPERPYLYREFAGYGGQQSIRVGDWKAIRQSMTKGNLEVELYNLSDDVGESNNVASEHPKVVEEMAAMMSSVRTPSSEFPLIPLDGPVKKRKPVSVGASQPKRP